MNLDWMISNWLENLDVDKSSRPEYGAISHNADVTWERGYDALYEAIEKDLPDFINQCIRTILGVKNNV